MAANLDKAESSLTAVSDIAYIRGIDSSGNSVRISKADLASVLGALVIKDNAGLVVSTDEGFDAARTTLITSFVGYNGTYFARNTFGIVVILKAINGYTVQIAFDLYKTEILWRFVINDVSSYSEWKKISFVAT